MIRCLPRCTASCPGITSFIFQIWNYKAQLAVNDTVLAKVHSLVPGMNFLAEFYKRKTSLLELTTEKSSVGDPEPDPQDTHSFGLPDPDPSFLKKLLSRLK
jgi:hypothetical protein